MQLNLNKFEGVPEYVIDEFARQLEIA